MSAGLTLLFAILLSRAGAPARLDRPPAAAIDAKPRRLRAGGAELIRGERVLAAAAGSPARLFWLLAALLAYARLARVLALFPRAWGEQLDDYLLGVLARLGLGIETLPNLLVAVLMCRRPGGGGPAEGPVLRPRGQQRRRRWLARPGHRRADPQDHQHPDLDLRAGDGLPYLPGAHTEAFKGMSVLIGLMVSLGASSVVGQAPAADPDVLAHPAHRRIRAHRRARGHRRGDHPLQHPAAHRRGAEVTIPNADRRQRHPQLLAHHRRAGFHDRHHGDDRLRHALAPGQAMLLEAAWRTDGVLADPPRGCSRPPCPTSTPNTAWSPRPPPLATRRGAGVLSNLHASIQDVFNENGVQIMSPHYMADPAQEMRAPENWYAPPARKPDAG